MMKQIHEVALVSGLDSIVLYEMLSKNNPNILPVYFKWGFDIDDAEIAKLPEGTVIHEIPEYLKFDVDVGSRECINLDGRDTIMMNMIMHIYKPSVIYKGTILNDESYVESNFMFTQKIAHTWSLINRKTTEIKHPFQTKSKRDVIVLAETMNINPLEFQYCYNESGNCGYCNKCRMTRLLSMYTSNPDIDFLLEFKAECDDESIRRTGNYITQTDDVVGEITRQIEGKYEHTIS